MPITTEQIAHTNAMNALEENKNLKDLIKDLTERVEILEERDNG